MIKRTNNGYFWFERKTNRNWKLAKNHDVVCLNYPKELIGKRVMIKIEEYKPNIKETPKEIPYFKIVYPDGTIKVVEI